MVAKFSETNDNVCLRMSGKGSTNFIVGETVECTTTVEISVEVPRKLGIDRSQYPAVSLLGTNLKNSTSYYKDACSTIARH